ncbi:transporter substrate-binding protein (plasmid) [Photobacterium sp. GJ3]|uniref:transporter substrate-binding protein n=1 Tax=Photobacterium sp. GJ3 TaxID=2829502 RepID=UPI001B8CA341|nr:transporter substrate-binding protein [Photobacterium sp. GJ3]QUJ69686.1 transporter substrate-binding protein [Photobacterium sp. GJ3]
MDRINIGLLFSTSGTYRHLGRNGLLGALYAIEKVNGDPSYPFTLNADIRNPAGVVSDYVHHARSLLTSNIHHLVGTITSSTRKEIIPDVREYRGLLWYGIPYEGYECDENVVYHGACPNQNLLPLLEYAVKQFGKRIAILGSNYVWGWESCRIAREAILSVGGEVLDDSFYHLDTLNFDLIIQKLKQSHPDFIINNLIGDSSYAFLHQLDNQWSHSPLPVLSCNLTECELTCLNELPHLRLYSSLIFFESLNPAFVAQARQFVGTDTRITGNFVGSYLSVMSLANAIVKADSAEVDRVCAVLPEISTDSPMSVEIRIAANQHAILPCSIGERLGDSFVPVVNFPATAPNPYLVGHEFLTSTSGQETEPQRKLRLIR